MNAACTWPEPFDKERRPPLAAALFPAIFLFYLVEAIIKGFEPQRPEWVGITVLLLSVAYGAAYTFGLWRGLELSHQARIWLVVACTLPPIAFALMMDSDDLIYLTYAVVAAMMLLPSAVGLAYGVTATSAVLAVTGIQHGSPNFQGGVILAILTGLMFTVRGFTRKSGELQLAKDEIRTLAVAEERARVARDLHDVLGHSLTTITLKAGLARRILESSADVDRALTEVHDVERLSRQALTEIRATVSGYRRVSLPAEIAGAKAALLAAGIDADLPQAVDDVPGELQEPFGYVLREGVTNVIRHSGASRCQIRLGQSWIEIEDNGPGLSTVDSNGGNGLAGLRERLAKVDGRLTAAPGEEGGFLLRADVST